MVINRYREATIALDYYGDSVLNSVSDIGAMALGFVLRRGCRRRVVGRALAMEIGVVYHPRQPDAEGLMLLHPLETVRQWQAGG